MTRLSRLELMITAIGAAFAVVAYPLHSDLVAYPAALLAVAGLLCCLLASSAARIADLARGTDR